MKTINKLLMILVCLTTACFSYSQKTQTASGSLSQKDLTGIWSYTLDGKINKMTATKSPGGYTFRRQDCSDKFFMVEWQNGGLVLTGNYHGVSFDSSSFTMPAAAVACPNRYKM